MLAVVWALALGALFGTWLQRRYGAELAHLSPRSLLATTYFSGSIGGASEMTLLAERFGARTDWVAAAHSMRLVMVVIAVPFGSLWAQHQWGLKVDASWLPSARLAQWPGLHYLGLVTAAGGWVMLKLRRNNPWFMGALLASMAVALTGWEWSAVPNVLSNAAQLVIGVSLVIRFRREFVKTAPHWLVSMAWGSLCMLCASVGFGMALAWGTGLHPATLILGTCPEASQEWLLPRKYCSWECLCSRRFACAVWWPCWCWWEHCSIGWRGGRPKTDQKSMHHNRLLGKSRVALERVFDFFLSGCVLLPSLNLLLEHLGP